MPDRAVPGQRREGGAGAGDEFVRRNVAGQKRAGGGQPARRCHNLAPLVDGGEAQVRVIRQARIGKAVHGGERDRDRDETAQNAARMDRVRDDENRLPGHGAARIDLDRRFPRRDNLIEVLVVGKVDGHIRGAACHQAARRDVTREGVLRIGVNEGAHRHVAGLGAACGEHRGAEALGRAEGILQLASLLRRRRDGPGEERRAGKRVGFFHDLLRLRDRDQPERQEREGEERDKLGRERPYRSVEPAQGRSPRRSSGSPRRHRS